MYKERWSEKSLFWNGLFHRSFSATAVYHLPIFAYCKGPDKRGHIVADTLLPTQMFPRLPARATFRDTKNVSDFVQIHFVSATNVSQFAQPKKYHRLISNREGLGTSL